ncbi:MAG: type VI secretion system baseplate subunit TssG [Methylococcaceae bacterium]|nr:type VI secretion system baseplate subunit TssG [Methylococcaceae bacterium]
MADKTRTTAVDLEAALLKEPTRYGFFQVMRLLECAYESKARFGQAQRPILEPPVRLGQDIALTFEVSTLTSYNRRKQGLMPLLKQRFMGLFGPNGPMPIHLTEYIHERIYHNRDFTLTGFADMFHHRMVCLFYRAWANNEPTVSYDRPDNDRFSNYIGSLAGFGADALRERDAMPDLAKLHYTGFLSSQSKSAEGLRALLADYFRFRVSVESFVGEWLTIQPNDLTRLGEDRRTGELGMSAILGSKVWGCQHKFRIRFGPLNLDEYLSLLPDGHRLEQLVAIIRNYIGDELSWDVNLVLKKAQVPSAQLGEQTRLGWTSWMGVRQSEKDAGDLTLNPFWGKV